MWLYSVNGEENINESINKSCLVPVVPEPKKGEGRGGHRSDMGSQVGALTDRQAHHP